MFYFKLQSRLEGSQNTIVDTAIQTNCGGIQERSFNCLERMSERDGLDCAKGVENGEVRFTAAKMERANAHITQRLRSI